LEVFNRLLKHFDNGWTELNTKRLKKGLEGLEFGEC
jgi:hypothetical protein